MRIRIAHLSDSHFDERNRLDDCVAVHQAFLEQARAAGVRLVIHAGDVFERRSTPAERNAFAGFLVGSAEDLEAPTAIVRGNHDAEGDLDIYQHFNCVRVFTRPTLGPGSAHDYGAWAPVAILALPWFSKAHLVSQLPPDLSADETTARAIDAARSLLTCIRVEAERCRRVGLTPILIAHVQVAGSEVSTGQTLIGQTVELAPGDLQDLGCTYVALGHIHKRQGWGNVCYSGSPNRCNFGEPEPKGWNLVTIEDGKLVDVEFHELPARRIALCEVEFDAAGNPIGDGGDEVLPGDLVRIRARVPTEALHLVTDDRLIKYFHADVALETKIETVLIHQARVRSEEIVKAADTWEKLRAFWQAAAIDVPEAAQARIRAKLEEIESRQRQEVADAAA